MVTSAPFAACLLAVAMWPVSAQSPPCDARLLGRDTDPYGYRLRGDRCEGIYLQEVSGSPLSIASWTAAFPDYDLTSNRPLHIEWELPDGRAVRLRAHSLRRRLYYQMDAQRPAGSKSYQWPPDLISALRIPRDELGVTGIMRETIGKTERDIYLPLRIRQGIRSAEAADYRLVLLPGVELKEVFLTIATARGNLLKNAEALGYGYYPAERAIEIVVAAPRDRGIYRVEIGATHKSGGASTAELWFYHPGNH